MGFGYALLTAGGDEFLNVYAVCSGEDRIDGAFADDVLYLAAGEVELGGERSSVLLREIFEHRLPDSGPGFHCGPVEADFVKEAALKKPCRGWWSGLSWQS